MEHKVEHYYRQFKGTGDIEEITRDQAIANLIDYFKDASLALDNSSAQYKLQTNFCYYWKDIVLES